MENKTLRPTAAVYATGCLENVKESADLDAAEGAGIAGTGAVGISQNARPNKMTMARDAAHPRFGLREIHAKGCLEGLLEGVMVEMLETGYV
jgi:hypothetical protein